MFSHYKYIQTQKLGDLFAPKNVWSRWSCPAVRWLPLHLLFCRQTLRPQNSVVTSPWSEASKRIENSNKIWHPHLDLDPTFWWLWLNYHPKEDKHKQDISLDEASTRQIQTVQDDIFSGEARFRGLRDFKAGRKQVTLNRSWSFLCSLLERH